MSLIAKPPNSKRLVTTLLYVCSYPFLWQANAATGATVEVQVRNFEFVPDRVDIKPGDTVRWIWSGSEHTVTSGRGCQSDGHWDSGDKSAGSFEQTFTASGQFPYFCAPHCEFDMTGVVNVAQASGPTLGISGSDTVLGLGETTLITFTFSAAPQGFAFKDIKATGGTLGVLTSTDNPNIFTIAFTQKGKAKPTVTVAAGAYTDGGGNPGQGASLALARDTAVPVALADPLPKGITPGSVAVNLATVTTGLAAPNWGTFAPGDSKRLFVADQPGTLWAIDTATGTKSVFGDLAPLLVPIGIRGPGTYDERGFLGLAFHPDYRQNGLLYTFTSEPVNGTADFPLQPRTAPIDHQNVVREWMVPNPTQAGSVVDPNSSRVVLRIDHPRFNHNGGGLAFGKDKLLYISLGDGGAGDDQGTGHSAQGNGQDTSTPLGKLLRIDPSLRTSANRQYGIPATNPFVGGTSTKGGRAGCLDGRCDEIYAYGFRNPFRFSFDMGKNKEGLYLGDVGQNDIEEVDIVKADGNYGWRLREGGFCFEPNGDGPGFVTAPVTATPACGPAGAIGPVVQYDHDEGASVIGGFVYRGAAVPALAGRYLFGDYSGPAGKGRLFHLNKANIVGKTGAVASTGFVEMPVSVQGGLGIYLLGFGQDLAGEVYLLGNGGGVPSGTTGTVLKIAP